MIRPEDRVIRAEDRVTRPGGPVAGGGYRGTVIVERLELRTVEGREVEFEAALCEVRQRLFMCTGYRGFTVAQEVERFSTYLVQVLWETLEERADNQDSGRLGRCWAPAAPFLADGPRGELFVQRPSLGHQGPGVITERP